MKLRKPTLIDNWKRVARKAWSMQLMLVAGFLAGCEAVITVVGVENIPVLNKLSKGWLSLVVMVIIAGAMVTRLLAQGGLDEPGQD